ncbi:large ribosomal subunit protein bL19cz-like [Silene latifolia]|uniref:large ribosomal subunit protein bL19cz-like n=1 Tax=Silene latifolia TaxID=37657 RepID=UPI003D76D257
MQTLIRAVRSQCRIRSEIVSSDFRCFSSLPSVVSGKKHNHGSASKHRYVAPSLPLFNDKAKIGTSPIFAAAFAWRNFATAAAPVESQLHEPIAPEVDRPARIKFKRPDKTARHIMQILDKEAVEEVKSQREIPDIQPGYIIQLKLEVPENKRRITTIKGIVIARRNAGLQSTFRLRRLVAGVGVESLLPLYSPNIKEVKVLDKKKVRRAKLYYLRDKMNALKK